MKDNKKRKLVVLTGAGISAESGLKTFRDSDGLWEGYRIEDVATPEAWQRQPAIVQDFYNERRKAVLAAEPNLAHQLLVDLETEYDVRIITQNVDNLHERAGSTNILHLHGEITKARSTFLPHLVYDIEGWELKMGQKCELGSQLRPHIVWFGETVPLIEKAGDIVSEADIFLIVGTSMQVYPAAGLVNLLPNDVPIYVIDPNPASFQAYSNVTVIQDKAVMGMQKFYQTITSNN